MADMQCPLAQAAEIFKDLPALITNNQTITYAEYYQLVATAAAKLHRSGVVADQRVAIVSVNSVEYTILLMALFHLGAVACPISPRLPEKSILEYMEKIKCTKLFDLSHQLTIDMPLQFQKLAAAEIVDFTATDKAPRNDSFISLDQDATIIGTSGTSGQPKAVLHTYGNHYYSAVGSNKNIKVQPGNRWLLSLPLYHIGGLAILFRTMLGGGAVVIADSNVDLLDMIRRYQITHLSLVHTQLYRLLQESSLAEEMKQLKAVLVGGSHVVKSLIKKAHEHGLPLFTTYGLTEMASQVTTTSPGDSLEKLLTSGRLLKHRQIKISTEGEIIVKGETLFRGYAEHDQVVLPVDSNGWFHTGDTGHLNGASYLTVLGRKDNMFISGGENVYPEEIEGALCLSDDVSEAVVVPMEDNEFGFRPVAFLRTAGNKYVRKSDLVARLEHHLPRFKIPVRFYEWPEKTSDNSLKPACHFFRELARTTELTEIT